MRPPPADMSQAIAATIRKRRQELSMSLDDVAKAAKATKSHIWEMERGNCLNPTIRMLLNVAWALRIDLGTLIGFDVSDPKFTDEEIELIYQHRRIFGERKRGVA